MTNTERTSIQYLIDGCRVIRWVEAGIVTWTVYNPSGFKVNEYKTARGMRRSVNRHCLNEWPMEKWAAAMHAAEFGNEPPTFAEVIAEAEAMIKDLAERYEEVRKAIEVPGAVQLADAMWAAIQEDMAEGVVPASVATFGELHEYVDANCYALDHLPDYSFEAHNALINAAEDICNVRLGETAPERLAVAILKQIDDDIEAEVMPVTVASLEEVREYVDVDDYLLGRGILLAARVDGDKAAATLIERALAVIDARLTERHHETVLVHGKRIEESRGKHVQPTRQTHEYVTDSSTELCQRQVEWPIGSAAPCGEPVNSPVHDPAAYLAYSTELRTQLRKWVAGEG